MNGYQTSILVEIEKKDNEMTLKVIELPRDRSEKSKFFLSNEIKDNQAVIETDGSYFGILEIGLKAKNILSETGLKAKNDFSMKNKYKALGLKWNSEEKAWMVK